MRKERPDPGAAAGAAGAALAALASLRAPQRKRYELLRNIG